MTSKGAGRVRCAKHIYINKGLQRGKMLQKSENIKYFYEKMPEMLDRALKKEYNTILHQYAK